jgi:protein-S-isoprenylcysteine O-methyltransferase Ste14
MTGSGCRGAWGVASSPGAGRWSRPLYVASVVAITGQALLLSRPVLLVYAAAFLAIAFFLVAWIEDAALARRFGQHFEDYRNQVPGWWPRLPRSQRSGTQRARQSKRAR